MLQEWVFPAQRLPVNLEKAAKEAALGLGWRAILALGQSLPSTEHSMVPVSRIIWTTHKYLEKIKILVVLFHRLGTEAQGESNTFNIPIAQAEASSGFPVPG